MARSRSDLNKILRDADVRVRAAAAKALNDAAEELIRNMKQNMASAGIESRTGRLESSFTFRPATAERLKCLVENEVYAVDGNGSKKIPKEPGKYNPAMKNRYKYGIPYGRILEFSPRFNRPFFYKTWYAMQDEIKEKIVEQISNAWKDKIS